MKKNACLKCGKETSNKKFCSIVCANTFLNGAMERRSLERDWAAIQKSHDGGIRVHDLLKKFGVSWTLLTKAESNGFFVRRQLPRKKFSEETKRMMSDKKRQWCKDYPEKMVWKNRERFHSVPCEHFKEELRSQGIPFVEEFVPLEDRAYSIDIAFPDKKIGIEINGNQHYEKTGKLKPYYQERHDLIESVGWRLKEIHYSNVWNQDVVRSVIAFVRENIDFVSYQPILDEIEKRREAKKRKRTTCPQCGRVKAEQASRCGRCDGLSRRRVDRPSKEDLEKLVNEYPMVKLGEKFGVSDNAVKKWCQQYGIELTSRRGYWTKKNVGWVKKGT